MSVVPDAGEAMPQVAADTGWPLTEAQAGLWYAQRLAPDNPAFNTAHALWIDGALDVAAFASAADRAAHEATALRLRMRARADAEALPFDVREILGSVPYFPRRRNPRLRRQPRLRPAPLPRRQARARLRTPVPAP